MKISIIGGTGYIGQITGLGLAVHGHDVICMDSDYNKLNISELPIFEECLPILLKEATDKNQAPEYYSGAFNIFRSLGLDLLDRPLTIIEPAR